MSALVTIAVPVHNAERWLRECLDSALAQTWPSCEVVVVDDHSMDGSVEIARSYGDRIRFFQSDRRGGNVARNLALREARGEWIQFLDADDFLLPEKIAAQFAESDGGENADVLYSQVLVHDMATGQREPTALTRESLAARWFAWQLPQTGGGLWRVAALRGINGWRDEQPCCQEHELYLRAIQAGLRFRHAPTPGAVYRVWSDETLCNRDPLKVITIKTGLFQKMRDWLVETSQWSDEHARTAGQVCFEMSRTIAKTDSASAAAYFSARRAEGLIRVAGPAAPASYRAALRLLGFRGAEWVARTFRRA